MKKLISIILFGILLLIPSLKLNAAVQVGQYMNIDYNHSNFMGKIPSNFFERLEALRELDEGYARGISIFVGNLQLETNRFIVYVYDKAVYNALNSPFYLQEYHLINATTLQTVSARNFHITGRFLSNTSDTSANNLTNTKIWQIDTYADDTTFNTALGEIQEYLEDNTFALTETITSKNFNQQPTSTEPYIQVSELDINANNFNWFPHSTNRSDLAQQRSFIYYYSSSWDVRYNYNFNETNYNTKQYIKFNNNYQYGLNEQIESFYDLGLTPTAYDDFNYEKLGSVDFQINTSDLDTFDSSGAFNFLGSGRDIENAGIRVYGEVLDNTTRHWEYVNDDVEAEIYWDLNFTITDEPFYNLTRVSYRLHNISFDAETEAKYTKFYIQISLRDGSSSPTKYIGKAYGGTDVIENFLGSAYIMPHYTFTKGNIMTVTQKGTNKQNVYWKKNYITGESGYELTNYMTQEFNVETGAINSTMPFISETPTYEYVYGDYFTNNRGLIFYVYNEVEGNITMNFIITPEYAIPSVTAHVYFGFGTQTSSGFNGSWLDETGNPVVSSGVGDLIGNTIDYAKDQFTYYINDFISKINGFSNEIADFKTLFTSFYNSLPSLVKTMFVLVYTGMLCYALFRTVRE